MKINKLPNTTSLDCALHWSNLDVDVYVAIGISLFFGWCFTVLGGMDDVVEPWALADDMYQLERLLKYFYMGALERRLCEGNISQILHEPIP